MSTLTKNTQKTLLNVFLQTLGRCGFTSIGASGRFVGRAEDQIFADISRLSLGQIKHQCRSFHAFVVTLGKMSLEWPLAVNDNPKAAYALDIEDVVFLPAPYELDAVISAENSDVFLILFSDVPLRRALEKVLGSDCDPVQTIAPFMGRPQHRLRMINRLLLAEFKESASNSIASNAILEVFFMELVQHIVSTSRKYERGTGLTECERAEVTARIEAVISRTLSLNDLASVLGLQPYEMTRRFKVSFGNTPQQFFMEKRLACAYELLVNSDVSLADISLQCGFSSQPHFSKYFVREFGVSPGRFRQQKRINSRN